MANLKNTVLKGGFALALLMVSSTAFAAHKWKLAPGKTQVKFKVSHFLLTSVTGKFKKYSGEVMTPDLSDFSGSVINAKIDVGSVDTGNDDRDEHLRNDEFFNMVAFPTMNFTSTSVEKVNDKKYKMHGKISIRDVTHPITLDVKFKGVKKLPNGKKLMQFDADGNLDRTKFGLTWNEITETGGIAVGNDVKIIIKAALVEA